MKTDATLQRKTLADQVAQQLLQRIRAEAMGPGSQLASESELADSFGISRPVVREALGQLKSIGLIELQSGKRPTVQSIDGRLPRLYFELSLAMDSSGVLELLEVRRGLEVESASLAARRASDADCDRLERLAAEMKARLDAGDHQAFIDLDVQLHLSIASISANVMLYQLIESIRDPMRDSIGAGIAARNSQQELERIHALHLGIVAAIRARDNAAAARAMISHFDDALVSIVAAEGMKSTA